MWEPCVVKWFDLQESCIGSFCSQSKGFYIILPRDSVAIKRVCGTLCFISYKYKIRTQRHLSALRMEPIGSNSIALLFQISMSNFQGTWLWLLITPLTFESLPKLSNWINSNFRKIQKEMLKNGFLNVRSYLNLKHKYDSNTCTITKYYLVSVKD